MLDRRFLEHRHGAAEIAVDAGRDSEALRQVLLAHRNPDGGWGYYPDKTSRLEPTCWASLALSLEGDGVQPPTAAALGRLCARWTSPQGLLAEPGLPPNPAFNGLACLVLVSLGDPAGRELAGRVASGLVSSAGITLPQSDAQRQDNTLRGWPWIDGTFSWVEPTSWCLLALKQHARAMPGASATVSARVREAERLLADRRCARGGWNYGNSNVFGRDLSPYVPTTAIALLALQDRPNDQSVSDGLQYLRAAWPTEPSGMALALTAICFTVFGVPTADVRAALVAALPSLTTRGNLAVIGMALSALASMDHGRTAFAL